MPLKDVLVHTDNSANSEVRLEYATRLAEIHDAHLTGLYVASPMKRVLTAAHQTPNYILPDLGGRSLRDYEQKAKDLHAEHSEHIHLAADSARMRFEGLAKKRKLRHEWDFAEGAMMEVLTHHARFCDVAVVGQPGPDSARRFGETVTDHLVLSVGHPVLVVPTLAEGFTVGKRVMIAWDRSPLATRAVHNSRPFLRNAESVTILAINLAPETQGKLPGSGICEHLARHDIVAEPIRVKADSEKLADVILATAEERGVDLIIMGAYGHSRLRERILGGVTYDLLNGSPVPMLMNH
jgi:nucleotide-binding universal stress UspA family protein